MVKALACDSRLVERSRVQLPAVSLLGNDLMQVDHTHVPLSTSSIVWYQCPATGKVTVGLASHWPCITDVSGLSTYGLKAVFTVVNTGVILETREHDPC